MGWSEGERGHEGEAESQGEVQVGVEVRMSGCDDTGENPGNGGCEDQ